MGAQEIARRVQSELAKLPDSLRDDADKIWQSVARVDEKGKISQITRLFAASLHEPVVIYDDIAAAHFYMWMAYTLYDRIIDGEVTVAVLPLANVLLRSALSYCPDLHDAFLKMDAANAWELTYARARIYRGSITFSQLPLYGDGQVLVDRAYGHIASCVRMVLPVDQPVVVEALSQYVIARQLNDDLHDWVEDLRSGQLTYVVTSLLQTATVPSGKYAIDELLVSLRRQFWETEVERLCQEVIDRTERAKAMLQPLLAINSPFDTQVLNPISQVAHAALRRHRLHRAQLAAYQRAHGV